MNRYGTAGIPSPEPPGKTVIKRSNFTNSTISKQLSPETTDQKQL